MRQDIHKRYLISPLETAFCSNSVCVAEKTKNRHRFYCRSKLSKGQHLPPKRSCIACVRAKVRCDVRPGKCARCESKGLRCEWPPRTGYLPKKGSLSSQRGSGASEASTDLIPSTFSSRTQKTGDELNHELTSGILTNANKSEYRASTQSGDLSGVHPLNSLSPATGPVPNLLNEKQLDLFAISARLAQYGAPFQSYQFTAYSITFPYIPKQVSTRNEWRAFQHRIFSNPVQKQSAATLRRFLASYPTMMLRQATFPPFIHPQCIPDVEGNVSLLGPLDRCVELARAFRYRTRENAEIVWRDIRVEHERLWTEV
jgi:Fungal Zn(2)-Cys(6) binuclear cluster domain